MLAAALTFNCRLDTLARTAEGTIKDWQSRISISYVTGLPTQERRRTAAIPRRTTRKIPRVSDDEPSTSPKNAADETIARTITANAMKIDKSSGPKPCGCSFHTMGGA